jgi:hypothetical protein
MTTAKHPRIGIQLTPAQQARLQHIHAQMGVPQSRFLCACVEVLTDEEVVDIMARFAAVKAAAYAERLKAFPLVDL